MEIDPSKDDRKLLFGDKNTKLKIDNTPLRSCYQRLSDAPLYNSGGAVGYTISSSRRRRSVMDEDDEDVLSVFEYREKLARTKRQTSSYDYNAFCDRVFESSSSTLAT